MRYPEYDRIRKLNFIGYGHFNHGMGYNTHADYDTNAPSIEHFLGKTNAYLHYLDHIFSEILEVLNDILIRLEEIEKDIDDLKKYKHVPSKLDKTDNKHDYIVVKNENRTQADGLAEGLVDTLQQHHLMDTSKLDSIIEIIIKNIGIRTEIAGSSRPGDGTCISLGDISKFDEVFITWNSAVQSIPRATSEMAISTTATTSFTAVNVNDSQPMNKVITETMQTLAHVNGALTSAQLCFEHSQWMRFVNEQSDNNGWHSFQNAEALVGNVWFPSNPDYGDGWIHIIKIEGVNYSVDAFDRAYEIVLDRLEKNQYINIDNYLDKLNHAISAQRPEQLAFLEYLEEFEEELKQMKPVQEQALVNYQINPISRYDELKAYRDVVRGAMINV